MPRPIYPIISYHIIHLQLLILNSGFGAVRKFAEKEQILEQITICSDSHLLPSEQTGLICSVLAICSFAANFDEK